MSEIVINKVVVHELVKDQYKSIKNSFISKKPLNVTLNPVKLLVDGIVSLYGKKNNTAHYGIFGNNKKGKYPDAFNTYYNLKSHDDSNFMRLSKIGIDELYQAAKHIPAASGGYILFSDYSNNHGRYMLIAMIKPKEGLTLSQENEELVPEELSQIDLSRLYQAARISFGKYAAYKVAKEEERQELNYLSFVSPSSSKSAAGYFVTALGCVPGTAAAQATKNVVNESVNYFRNRKDLEPYWYQFKGDLINYLWKKEEKGESVKLSEIERLARQFIPAEDQDQADETAKDFISHLNSEDVAVPVEFPVNKPALKKLRQIRYTTGNWDLSFEKTALGDTDNAEVFYDRDQQRLVLSALPDKMISLIEKELSDRKKE